MTDTGTDIGIFTRTAGNIKSAISKVIVGKENVIDLLLTALICSGHVLIEDMPGTGKTLLAKTLARALDLDFKRVQFTPDLLPGDLTGTSYFNQKEGEFVFRPGPVFTNILLADEINRATPRTQSSLLECMQEGQVTADTETRALDRPFMVIATQNPIETHGTFPLPEAQLDRFLMKVRMGYPPREEGMEIMRRFIGRDPLAEITPVAGKAEILELQREYSKVHVSDAIMEYILRILEMSRNNEAVETGLSPRSSQALLKASQAYAALQGRDYVLPDDVKQLAVTVLAHRLKLVYAAHLEKNREDAVIREITEKASVPAEKVYA